MKAQDASRLEAARRDDISCNAKGRFRHAIRPWGLAEGSSPSTYTLLQMTVPGLPTPLDEG